MATPLYGFLRDHFMKLRTAIVTGAMLVSGLQLLAGCATLPPQNKPPLSPGREMETLQSSVTIAVRTGEKSAGGRGYLIYRHPDRFHFVLLSPFGSTLFELYLDGERLTCVVPSRKTAYAGLVSELPDNNILNSWGLMRWAAERTPDREGSAGTMIGESPTRGRQVVTYDDRGLVEAKEDKEGDRVYYQDYEEVNGVALPRTIDLHDWRGTSVRIVFDEPEVNGPVEESAFSPVLDGMNVLPIEDFTGW